MRFGVIVFPGTWSDVDCFTVVDEVLKQPVEYVWHKETDLSGFDCLILPGGFSYGDYLRSGAIARFSPVMKSVERFAKSGGLVFGICNGFQILCESGLLPGILRKNDHLEFRCQWTHLRVENVSTPFSNNAEKGQIIKVPMSSTDGGGSGGEYLLMKITAVTDGLTKDSRECVQLDCELIRDVLSSSLYIAGWSSDDVDTQVYDESISSVSNKGNRMVLGQSLMKKMEILLV